MASQPIQVLGLTRWSYPFNGKGFRQSGGTLDDVRARLYAPHRLDYRLFLLEHVTLPTLRAQTDPDFKHLILIGDQLPDPWRSQILELVKDIPQVVVEIHPEGQKHQDLCREIMFKHVDPDCYATAQFRLDDDDSVSTNFVEKTRKMFPKISSFFEQDGQFAVDFSRGFILRFTDDDVTTAPVAMRFWAPGMAIFQRPDSKNALLDFHHLKVWHSTPTLMCPEEPMFIRGAHHDNDSHLPTFGRRTRGFKFDHKNPARYFERRFGFDLPAMNEIWASKKDYFRGQETKVSVPE